MPTLIHRSEPAQVPNKSRHWARTALQAGTALVLFFALFVWIGGVTRIDLNKPLVYSGDALETLAYFDHDYIHNDIDTRMHAPFELTHQQVWYYPYNALFQSNSNLIWLVHLVSGDNDVRTLNTAYLTTFLLVFWIAWWVCGRLGLKEPFRFGAAALYALMPYHFQRSVNHFWESSYYLTPLLALVIVQLWSARPLAHRMGKAGWELTWRDRRAWLAIILVVFLSSFHPYHQFFFAVLVASAAPFAALYRKSWRPLLVGLALAALAMGVLMFKDIVTRLLVNPELALSINGQAIGAYGGAEMYPLKLAQMLLPVEGHRWQLLANIRASYDAANPLINENTTTTLGLLGGFGLIVCLVLALVPSPRWRMSRVGKMGLITLLALLFASMGGISSLISTASFVLFGPNFPLTQTRGWDRMVIFVGFFAYFTAFWLLSGGALAIHRRFFRALPRAAIAWPAFLIVFAFALWDQVPGSIQQQSSVHFDSDHHFFSHLDATLPEQARVFQLPFVIHHASGWVLPGVYYSEALRPYLASKTLRFTYGGDEGSAQVQWLAGAIQLAPDQLAPHLCRYGFSGLLLQRNMVEKPAAIEANWSAQLGAAPQISDDKDMAFYDLREFCESHAIPPLDVAAIKSRLIEQASHGVRVIPAAVLQRQIGRVEAEPDGGIDVIGTNDENGYIAFGPYEDLKPGRYVAEFVFSQFEAIAGSPPLVLDVAASRGAVESSSAHTDVSSVSDADGSRARVSFEIAPDMTRVQYRVLKPRGVGVHVREVRIHAVGK